MSKQARPATPSAAFPYSNEPGTSWLFPLILLLSLGSFLAAGLYLRTVEPPPSPEVTRLRRISTQLLVTKRSRKAAAKPKPTQKKPAPSEPVDLTRKPLMKQKEDDVQEPKKEKRVKKVRRVYGTRRVYARGLGAEGSLSDAVIGKRGNTLNKSVDTLTATEKEIAGEVVSVTTVTSPPRYKKRVKPQYTPEMLENRIEGVIKVRLLVDTDGLVKKAVLLNDLGYGSGRQALAACREFRFHPALRDDEPVAVWIVVPLRFVLLE